MSVLDNLLSRMKHRLLFRQLRAINQHLHTRFADSPLSEFCHSFFDESLCEGALILDIDKGLAAVVYNWLDIEVVHFDQLRDCKVVSARPETMLQAEYLRVTLSNASRTYLDIPFQKRDRLSFSGPHLLALQKLNVLRRNSWPEGTDVLLFA